MNEANKKTNKDLHSILNQVAKQIQGPFYLYDLEALETRLHQINYLKPDDIDIYYACKANPLSAILQLIRRYGFGVDVASLGELAQATEYGFRGDQMIATGPAKSKAYLYELLEHSIDTIVIESPNQLIWLDEVVKEKSLKKPNVLLRLQLEWNEGSSILGGSQITPFGLGIEDWKNFFNKNTIDSFSVNIQGCHIFQWGNITEASELTTIWDKICSQTKEFCRELHIDLQVIDLGGGLGIQYHQQEGHLDLSELFSNLKSVKQKHQIPKIWLELGRYISGEFGIYCTQVIDRKNVRGKNLLVLEGGINHLLRPAVADQSFPCFDLKKKSTTTSFQIHGPLCTALDNLGTFELSSDLTPHDWVYFTQAGAYGFTESMPYFLCHDLPAEVIIQNGRTQIIRQKKSAVEWLK